MNSEQIEALQQRVIEGGEISREEALALSATPEKEALYAAADRIRAHFMGPHIDLCSIMNAQSGRCSEDCNWCSQSIRFKTGVAEYPLVSAEEGVHMAQDNSRQGVERFSLVTSGRALKPAQVEAACGIYRAIGTTSPIRLCASMGLLRSPELQKLKDAGVERYHCNIETAASHFPTLCTTHSFEEKVRTIREAQALGMKVCSGGIFGMGESMAQRIEMAFTLRELAVDSIPINILNPIEGTPLQGSAPLSDDEILVSIALFRFINPTAHLRFAGGRNLIFHIQEKALAAGISAALVGDYLTTLGASIEQDREMFRRLGRGD
ncbi:biotin synthase BioB [Rhodocyclus purpureus]|uniref:biotin synthase BioB n=1 Tax=Rhodocyclus purpureus TaxID=1067 RepID=UPI00191320A9|nr:biotin synthase BioB [Rhodocyclus purpureus]MBK5915423.1 biotin synthase BioB [Rhodocyclus purpureus]